MTVTVNRYGLIRAESMKTLREVSAGADVSERTLMRIERGEQQPSLVVAGKLAQFYGITVAAFLGIESEDA